MKKNDFAANEFEKFTEELLAVDASDIAALKAAVAAKNIIKGGVDKKFWSVLSSAVRGRIEQMRSQMESAFIPGTQTVKDQVWDMLERGVIRGLRMALATPEQIVELGAKAEKELAALKKKGGEGE